MAQGVIQSSSLVTCVIIFKDPGNYLAEAIESILAQTYPNWELLLVDDGSKDAGTEIAKRYAAKHAPKIRYLEHPDHANRGMSASRNAGVRAGSGEYIAFLDADDLWTPVKLAEQVELLQKHPECAYVYGPLLMWHSWSGKPEDAQRDYVQDIGVAPDTVVQPPALVQMFLRDERYVPSGMLVRRSVLEQVGCFEEEFRTMYEDMVVHAKICLDFPVYASGQCWYHYRQHEAGCCATAERDGRYHASRERFLEWVENYLVAHHRQADPTWAVLQKELRRYRFKFLFSLVRYPLFNNLKERAKNMGKRMPPPVRAWLRARWRRERYVPPAGWVRMAHLRRTTPIARDFGFERGLPVDRHYIEQFLANCSADIKGRVLEIGDSKYTRRFGGSNVIQADVLHAQAGNPAATIVGNLETGENLPGAAFDCIILTQTLLCIYDFHAAVRNVRDALKPGGVLLATVPCIAQVSRWDRQRWGDYWRFTSQAARRVFSDAFGETNVTVETHGNALTATALIHGITCQELTREELDSRDDEFEVIVSIRAVRSAVNQAAA